MAIASDMTVGMPAITNGQKPASDDPEGADLRERQRVEALDRIGQALENDKNRAVTWRAPFEVEWAESYRQYNTSARGSTPGTKARGAAMPDQTEGDAAYRESADNITRPKVIITASRLGDMLFPTNEANWDLTASPKPDVPDNLVPPPQPVQAEDGSVSDPKPYTPEEIAKLKLEIATKRAVNMKTTIRDQFAECKYDEVGRQVIFDACLYGPGIAFGPALKNYKRHSFASNTYASKVVEGAQPCVEYVDLWSFYPQPCRNIRECEHAFRLHILPKRSLRQLAREPGFDAKQIQRLLNETPQHGALAQTAIDRGQIRPDINLVLSDRYSVWQYRGPMPKDGFLAFIDGMVAQGVVTDAEAAALEVELSKDSLNEMDCEVWVSQGIVIKMAASTLEPGELGYYVFNYEDDPNAIFGHGVAYLCSDDQHAANQLWHAMMLNSMMSAGPQIGVRRHMLDTAGGRRLTLTADRPRTWVLNEDCQDIKQALSVFVVPNVTDKIIALYERAKANADEHTMTPMIAQGEPTTAMPTSSGTAMLMNAANVVMRRLAKAWDDDITTPALNAFVNWNMANNPDDQIKGDFCVIPKGASYLLVKDVQTQHIQFATQLFATNPMLQPYMKPDVFARKNIEMLDLAPEEMLFTQDEVEAAAAKKGQQPDPETMKAQAAMATAQAAMKRAEIEDATAQRKDEFDRWERGLANQERMADISARQRIQEMQVQVSQNQLYHKMSELDMENRMHLRDTVADLQKHAASTDLGQYQVDAQTQLGAEKIASSERQAEIKAEAIRNKPAAPRAAK